MHLQSGLQEATWHMETAEGRFASTMRGCASLCRLAQGCSTGPYTLLGNVKNQGPVHAG